MTKLPEPNFIDRDPDTITKEWIEKYEEKSGKVLQPAQIERLMIDIGAYRETVLRMEIQETAKKNLLSYAPLDILKHIGEPLGVEQLLANCSVTTLKFTLENPLVLIVLADKNWFTGVYDGSLVIGNLMLAADSLGIGSCWIHRAKEEFEMPEYKELLKSLGIEGKWEGVGHCILGYPDEPITSIPKRKENRVYYIK